MPAATLGLVPFPNDPPNTIGSDWTLASSLVVTVPRSLISYYDQRLQVQLAGELFNGEAALCIFDTTQKPINFTLPLGNNATVQRTYFCQISQPVLKVIRSVSDLDDWSQFFRTGQVICFGVMARSIIPSPYVLARNLTAVLYFGAVSIGRQAPI
jgi:hypothetical protein